MTSGVTVVTGATGNIGSVLTRLLLKKGRKVRAVGRNLEKLNDLAREGAEVAAEDVKNKAAMARTFSGASTAFVMIPPKYDAADFRAYQNEVGESLAAAVKSAGVRHVVHLSSVGAELSAGNGLIAGLHDNEKRLNGLEANVAHLRPAYFMENHLGNAGLMKHKRINGTGLKADLPIAMIATRDIAVAAAGLLEGLFEGKKVDYLLGPKDYTMAEATRVLAAAAGIKDIPYVQFPYPDMEKALLGMGFSADVSRLFVEMTDGFNTGRLRPTEVRSPANTTPTTLEAFAPAFAELFQRN
jgi:uncharacterized protein YbjT (DUF2867 family)